MIFLWICWPIFLFLVVHLEAQLAPNSYDDQCDCGYHDPSSEPSTVWTNGWFMNFGNDLTVNNERTTLARAPTKTTISRLQQDFFMAGYEIAAKYEDTYSRVFSMDNVKMTNDVLQLAVTVNHTSNNASVRCGAIGTKRQDILYGTFRSQMRLTPINGTVQAMYFYNPDGEIDIEILGAVDPPQAYFALHPGLQEPNGRASALTHDNHPLGFNPTTDLHDYRFDWYPDRSDFYIDQQLAHTLVTNVPHTPGRLMFSHWTDGNVKFSKGPPTEDAVMEIASFVALFNTSAGSAMACQRTQQACSIQDVLNGELPSATPSAIQPSSTPEQQQQQQQQSSSTSSSADTNKPGKSTLVATLFLIGCTVILL
ncbi:hypothetical protein [Absidia glauca]|uniref:GH16 domain-containing protein n=1 Tax=Absidia glauca TaxID=4829 RepID=A0A163JJS3_ABSGL|nr:hypothetical protein [Absidia glauca]